MSEQVDPASTNAPEAIPSVRQLEFSPEGLTPVRHGFLWKRSRLFKTWLSRWFQLDIGGFLYAVSPKAIKHDGRPVLSSSVREVRQLPPQRYGNGATMYGIRVIAVSGAFKDVYSDDRAALDAWALDLSRSTPAGREAVHIAASAAAAAAAPLLPAPPRQAPRAPAGDLRLADICEVDWSHMLGSGLFACVLRGRMHGSGEPVAVKVIKAEAFRQYGDIVQREAAVWSAVGEHPHIAQLRQALRSRERMYFISDLCEGGGLVERLAASATYCEREVAWLMRQLLSAVAHLHANAIVHMDIKPENLVFASRREDSIIKLIDFSLASFFFSPTDPGGTPDFVAPELLNSPEEYVRNGCGPEVDMWAVGVMLFFLLSGQTPFQAPSLDMVLQRVKSGEWAFHGRRWALISDGARELVSQLLRREPSERLTAQEALAHPWLRRPDSLSQALLVDAVASFRTATAAAQAQLRTSWVKQGSGDTLMSTAGTNATAGNSPHTSLSRFATAGSGGAATGTGMGVPGGGGVNGAAGSALVAQPVTHSPRVSGIAADGVRLGSGGGGGAAGGLLMTSSASYLQAHPLLPLGGPSSRASRNSVLRQSAHSTAHTSAGTGYFPSPLLHSFTAGAAGLPGGSGGAAAAAAAGGMLGHAHSTGSRQAAALAATTAGHYSGAGGPAPVVRSSPLGSPHHSPGGSGTQPRSPLGLTRVRRASDTMAYTLAMTEQQESLTQMQAQGIPVPSNSAMQWPALSLAAVAAKARRASDMSSYAAATAAAGAAASAAANGSSTGATDGGVPVPDSSGAASAAATAGPDRRQPYPHHHPHPHHHQHNPPLHVHVHPLRGASGLSVMSGGSAGLAAARGDGRATGGRSNPELLRLQSLSNGDRTGAQSSPESGSPRARSGLASWASVPSSSALQLQQSYPHTQYCHQPGHNAGGGRSASGPGQQAGAHGPESSQGRAQPEPGQSQRQAADLPESDQAWESHKRKAGMPGKSHSYTVMPSGWLAEGQRRLLSGRYPSTGTGYTALLGGGSVAGTGGGASGGGPAAAGGIVAIQRRASTSFTLGTGMPHGPSPLSNASAGRRLAGAVAAAAAAVAGPAAAGPLQGKHSSRGDAFAPGAGVVVGTPRSGCSTPASGSQASLSSSSSVPPPHVGNAPGSGGGATAAVAGTGYAGSSALGASMYATVLRQNLPSHSLVPGAGGGEQAFDMGDIAERRRRISARSSNSSSRLHMSAAAVAAVAAGLAAGGSAAGGASSMSRPESLNTLTEQLLLTTRASNDEAPSSSGIAGPAASSAAPAAPAGMPQMLLGSSGFNAVSMWSNGSNQQPQAGVPADRRASQPAAFVDEASSSHGQGGAGCGLASRPGSTTGSDMGGRRGSSGVRLLASLQVPRQVPALPPLPPLRLAIPERSNSESAPFLEGFDGLSPEALAAAGMARRRRSTSGPQSRVAAAAALANAAAAAAGVYRRGDSGNASGHESGDGSGGYGGGVAASALRSDDGAGRASALGGTAGLPTLDMLITSVPPLRSASRRALETIPSEDPESFSGLLRAVREDRATTTGAGDIRPSRAPSQTQLQPQPQPRSQLPGTSRCPPFNPQSLLSPVSPHMPLLPHAHASAFCSPQVSHSPSLLESPVGRGGGGGGSEDGLRVRGGVDVSGVAALRAHSASAARSGDRVIPRRAATVNNLRLHATTAAAAQAAAAAAVAQAAQQAAAAAESPAKVEAPEQTEEPDPFAGWDWPPPPPPNQAPQRATSSGLSGASLAALLQQAAPLAQAAQAHAAAQLALSQGGSLYSSGAGSFTSQRSGWRGRAAAEEVATVAGAGASAINSGSGGGGGGYGGGGFEGGHGYPFTVGPNGPHNPHSQMGRRSSTAANMSFTAPASAAAAAAPTAQSAAQVPLSGANSPVTPTAGSDRTSNSVGRTGLAALLAQAGPLAAAAQANAAAQAAAAAAARSRGVSNSSHASVSSASSAGRALGAPLVGGGGSSGGSGSEVLAGWARRSTTANDLTSRVAAPLVQVGGNPVIHRLASQGSAAAATTAANAAAAVAAAAAAGNLYASSPPRETAGPFSGSSSFRAGSTYPAIPSRLSTNGAGARVSGQGSGGVQSGGGGLATRGSANGTAAAGGRGSGNGGSASPVPSLEHSPQRPGGPHDTASPRGSQQQQLQQLLQLQHLQQQLQAQQHAAVARGGPGEPPAVASPSASAGTKAGLQGDLQRELRALQAHLGAGRAPQQELKYPPPQQQLAGQEAGHGQRALLPMPPVTDRPR